jgi:hypothetical protein
MLRSMQSTVGRVVETSAGTLGHVTGFLLGLPYWTIRYFVVEPGTVWHRQDALISPMLILEHEPAMVLSVQREVIRDGPRQDAGVVPTRREEAIVLDYYGLPWYWAGPSLWGSASTAIEAGKQRWSHRDQVPASGGPSAMRVSATGDPVHLADSSAVFRTQVEGEDGTIGPIVDLIVQPDSWRVRYLVVETSVWSAWHHALISPDWITKRSWSSGLLTSRLTRRAIERAPRYDPVAGLTREQETMLHRYHGLPPYWQTRADG